ncbi:hypothetical protein UNSW3_909 [Campylobacter concisus UNSW3]|uniref:Uncharacterized protein n=1 Tax=Campylobacter concisus UNSW3 TaxID=1242966 RepID=U2G645_9BACT|nr:hypothetical protein UNSW3_909 [Campylobacter concisus UNSW3]
MVVFLQNFKFSNPIKFKKGVTNNFKILLRSLKVILPIMSLKYTFASKNIELKFGFVFSRFIILNP